MIAAAPSSAHPPATAYTILYLPSVTARMNGATAGAIENGSALALQIPASPCSAGPDGCWEPPVVPDCRVRLALVGRETYPSPLVQQRCQGVPQHRRGEAPRRGVLVSTNGLVATASLLGVEGWCG